MSSKTSTKPDQLTRCPWLDCSKRDYVDYHDNEWGEPVFDDRTHFEYLTLESAQAGLSWYTILKRRDNYRQAFANFDVEQVARFDDDKVEALMNDAGIIRNRAKILAAINNAQQFIKLAETEGSFSDFIWRFVNNQPIILSPSCQAEYRATSPESDKLAAELKRRGFKFVGSTICYAHMQAAGLINEHSADCFKKQSISR